MCVCFNMDLVILLEQRCQARNSVVAYTHNPCYLGGLGRRISVWGKQKLDNENLSQKNVSSAFLLPCYIYYLIL